jgi:hypothetical protein
MDLEGIADADSLDDEIRSSVSPHQARRRQFESIRDAINFLMEDLLGSARRWAWIASNRHRYDIEEIMKIYESEEFKNVELP